MMARCFSRTTVSTFPPEEVDPIYKRWTLDLLPILPEEFKLKAKTSKEAQRELDRLSIEKSRAEVVYTEAKTKALNRGSLSPEQILELLNRAREQGQKEGAEDAVH